MKQTQAEDFPADYTVAGGFHYRLLKTDGHVGVYEAKRNGRSFFEVIRLKWSDGWKDRIKPGWKVPGHEDWGTYGWTATSSEYAMAVFDEKGSCAAAV